MADSSKVILAIDQGTTGTRALLYDKRGQIRAASYEEFTQYYPKPGWVEHDAQEILRCTLRVIAKVISKGRVLSAKIAAIGITNQRETTVLWDRKTGKPISKAIVWQDRRTASFCDELRAKGFEPLFRRKTGLVLDPYFSGTKIKWLLDQVPDARAKAKRGDLLFGTIDTWLLWNLTGQRVHATDVTNASRTLLFNLKKISWDTEILKLLKIPSSILPQVHPSSFMYGKTADLGALKKGIPICALVGDQQGALFGQGCYHPGEMKNTYGTGCFVMVNYGKKYQTPTHGLLATLACDEKGKPSYALEGAIFIAGAAVQWLRDGLGFIKKAKETEKIARSLKDTGGVVVVPALAGLGAPYWNPHVRGAIFGLTRGTRKEHITKATVDSIAYQTYDVFESMARSVGRKPRFLKVDGGATSNSYLMQLQADLLGVPVYRSDITELTAWGAAKLAGIQSGFWKSVKEIDRLRKYKKFTPQMPSALRKEKLRMWREAIYRLTEPFEKSS